MSSVNSSRTSHSSSNSSIRRRRRRCSSRTAWMLFAAATAVHCVDGYALPTARPRCRVVHHRLHLSSASPAAALLVRSTVLGGLLSGGLHAVSGPDHLAALLPPSVGKPGWYGMKLGATWGLGHALSALLLGLGAFFLKGRLVGAQFAGLQRLSSLTEGAVGLSLLFIGVMGLRENAVVRGDDVDSVSGFDGGDGGGASSSSSAAADHDGFGGDLSAESSRAIFANGVLHGCSWDGAPSLAPALAMTSWRAAVAFLLAYGVGTMAAMSLTAGLVGAGSLRLGEAVGAPRDLPRTLSLGSSVCAVAIGAWWVLQALVFRR